MLTKNNIEIIKLNCAGMRRVRRKGQKQECKVCLSYPRIYTLHICNCLRVEYMCAAHLMDYYVLERCMEKS